MCLVAYLSVFGVTFGMASLALSVLGPLAVALGMLALGFALWRAKVPSFRDRAQGDMEAAAEPKRGCGMHTEQLRIPHDSR
jgi:hypothetical protein